jgi:hypothetical protein
MKKNALSWLWLIGAVLPVFAEDADVLKDDGANIVEIKRVSVSSTPVMKNDSLLYSLNLIFKDFPAKFWSYSDSANHTATIEIFGNEVRAPAITLPLSCPVTDIQIKNSATKMALSGQMATITFSIDPGWHAEIAQLDSNDIQLSLGKKMAVRQLKETPGKKKR